MMLSRAVPSEKQSIYKISNFSPTFVNGIKVTEIWYLTDMLNIYLQCHVVVFASGLRISREVFVAT